MNKLSSERKKTSDRKPCSVHWAVLQYLLIIGTLGYAFYRFFIAPNLLTGCLFLLGGGVLALGEYAFFETLKKTKTESSRPDFVRGKAGWLLSGQLFCLVLGLWLWYSLGRMTINNTALFILTCGDCLCLIMAVICLLENLKTSSAFYRLIPRFFQWTLGYFLFSGGFYLAFNPLAPLSSLGWLLLSCFLLGLETAVFELVAARAAPSPELYPATLRDSALWGLQFFLGGLLILGYIRFFFWGDLDPHYLTPFVRVRGIGFLLTLILFFAVIWKLESWKIGPEKTGRNKTSSSRKNLL